jgi:hypothetical protein
MAHEIALGRLTAMIMSSQQLLTTDEKKHDWIHGPHEAFRAQNRRSIFMSISIFCFHNQPINGSYFEFGCHPTRIMRLAWDCFHSLYDWTYVAFDSCEWLPEIDPVDSMPIWKKGDLKTSETDFVSMVSEHGMPREKLKIVKRFYKESLAPAERNCCRKEQRLFISIATFILPRPALIRLDADKYCAVTDNEGIPVPKNSGDQCVMARKMRVA